MAMTSGSFSFSDRNPIAGLTDRPSALPSGQEAKNTYLTNLNEYSLPGFKALKTVDDFVASLDALGVLGPLTLHTTFTEAVRLGEGAQFSVYAGSLLDSSNCEYETTLDPVAIKRCMFKVQNDKRLDLTSPRSRRQVHDMHLEIMALQHADLKFHRNIVRLLGWGIEEAWHETPLLVLELAIADLHSIFEKSNIKMTCGITQQLSIDVGQGLDAIHEAGIIHGDIKPQNILIFKNFSDEVPLVAKLADFGLSVGEVQASMNNLVEVSGMSSDWCALEIKYGSKLSTSQLIKADNFSYGLLVLSVNCLKGQPPASKDLNTALEVIRSCPDMLTSLSSLLETALALLLREDGLQRPLAVGDILKDKSEQCIFWEQDEAGQALYKKEDAQRPFVHPWRLPSLAAFLFQGLEKSYQRYKTWMTGPQLFAMFLLKSYGEVRKVDKSLQMEMLLAAAEKGHIPAQAVVSRVSQSYNIPHDVNKTFLYNGASYGSLLARRELEILDSALAFEALDKFRSSTGFNQFYSPLVATDEYSDDIKDAGDNTYIHFLSARGEFQKLRESLLANGTTLNINARNFRGETALYKACLTGCWETVRELCQHRADASISVLLNEVTCLHWLFNFPSTHVDQIATVLVNVGADLNALASPTPSIIDYHFPFSWPSGTPLHFATFASNPTAVTTLLKLGARAGLRNGRDPYLSDENVRQLHRHGTAEEGEFSEPDKPCLGLSSVDLATAMHDATVLECIRTHSAEDALFSPDEEGYTPFHRLSYLRVVRTYHGLRFWYPAFTGKSNDVKERLIKTIKVLQSMGGDINQLTNTPARPALRGVSGLSPLQIAVTKSDCEAVAALLECGADPNMVNRDGRSPLTLLAHVDDPCVTPNSLPNIVGLLLKYSPKVNHKSLDDVTPLGAAIASGSMPSVQALIDAGADPSSAESGVNIIAELMHQSSYQRRLQPPSVKSQAEAEAREQDIVRILKWLDLGSPKSLWVSKVDKDNGSLLHYASRAGLVDCVTVLINADLDINCIRKLHFVGAKPPSYSGTAGFMPAGTPLDIVERQHEDFISGKRDRMSQEDAQYIVSKFEAVKKLLREHGALSSDQLHITVVKDKQ